MSHSLTPHHGLLLLVSHVQPDGPAWQSGLRQGDAICQVNEWSIARMDRPEVKEGKYFDQLTTVLSRLPSTCYKLALTGLSWE